MLTVLVYNIIIIITTTTIISEAVTTGINVYALRAHTLCATFSAPFSKQVITHTHTFCMYPSSTLPINYYKHSANVYIQLCIHHTGICWYIFQPQI